METIDFSKKYSDTTKIKPVRGISRVYISSSNVSLVGQYDVDSPIVVVLADSSGGEFTINMPPVGVAANTIFYVYNYHTYGSGNNVTISSSSINNGTSIVLGPSENAIITDSLVGRYLAMIVR